MADPQTAVESLLEAEIRRQVASTAPDLLEAFGVGPDGAATFLLTAGDNPGRLRSEAAFAALCGASPIPASSGKTTRHRLNRGGSLVPIEPPRLPDLPCALLTAHGLYEAMAVHAFSGDPQEVDLTAALLANPLVTDVEQARGLVRTILDRAPKPAP
jgi:hypothetical protein